MSFTRVAIGVVWLAAGCACFGKGVDFRGEGKFGFFGKTSAAFLMAKEGGRFLGQADGFIEAMSPFDRSARLMTAREVSTKELLRHASAQSRNWTPGEMTKVRRNMEAIADGMAGFKLQFPPTVFFIKTTGREEGNAAYTRLNAIILPAVKLKQKDASLRRLLAHELFHVLSRANPKLATRLYRIIGYEPAPALKFPAELLPRKLTNPDAPFSRHVIEICHEGRAVKVAPILYARADKYDEKLGGPFFRYLIFRLLVLDEKDRSRAARDADGRLILLKPDEASGFHEKVGRNTGYIIHPEETMADNFVFLALGRGNLPHPEIVRAARVVLQRGGK